MLADALGETARNGVSSEKRTTRMNQGAEKLMKPESNNESNNHESDRGGEGIRGRLERFFAFDRHDMRYELTEREAGEPKSFGGWKDIAPQGEPDFRPVPADINAAGSGASECVPCRYKHRCYLPPAQYCGENIRIDCVYERNGKR